MPHRLRRAAAGETSRLGLPLVGVGRTESSGSPRCMSCVPGKTRLPRLPRSVSAIHADFVLSNFFFQGGEVNVCVV